GAAWPVRTRVSLRSAPADLEASPVTTMWCVITRFVIPPPTGPGGMSPSPAPDGAMSGSYAAVQAGSSNKRVSYCCPGSTHGKIRGRGARRASSRRQLRSQHVVLLDAGSRGQQLARLGHERRGDPSVQVGVARRLAFEHVEDR